jgi:anti-sigma factor RsiW
MNCNEARQWLAAHLDGELDLARDAELVSHVSTCAACRVTLDNQRAWRDTIQHGTPRWTPSPALEAQVRASVRPAATVWRWPAPRWMGATALAAAALAGGFVLGSMNAEKTRMTDELIAAHTLALTDGHLTDVASTDRHTVKPWFAEHLSFSPPVADLGAEGYPLIGGRVERIDDQPVAALLYQRHRHVITAYVAPVTGPAFGVAAERRGYRVQTWSDAQFRFAVVSDVAADDLAAFVERLKAATR